MGYAYKFPMDSDNRVMKTWEGWVWGGGCQWGENANKQREDQ